MDHLNVFQQPLHVESRRGMTAEAREKQREVIPARLAACFSSVQDDEAATDVEFALACCDGIKAFARFDKKQFLRDYTKCPALEPFQQLVLEGQERGLFFDEFDDEDLVDELRGAAPAGYELWDTRGWGSVQGLKRGDGDSLVLQCTALGITRRDPPVDDMYEMKLDGVDPTIRRRLIFSGVCQLVYSDLMQSPHLGLTAVCNGLKEQLTDPAQAPCSEADHYRINWLPYTAEEADYLAFGTKVPVDMLPVFVAAIRRHQPDFEMEPEADLRLSTVDMREEDRLSDAEDDE